MAQFKDVIDPQDLKRLMGGPSVINQPSTIEYDTKAFKRADPLAAITGGMRGLEESRALSQGGWELAAKGLGNIVENVVFETLKAPGTIASGIGMATGGSELLVNNFWLQSFDAIQKATLGKITEVYVPPSVQDKGLWGQIFNPYFFAGEGADAVGTMLSMMIPGRWMATLGVGDKIAKGLSKAGRLGELAADGTRMVTELGDANKFGKFMVKTLGATGRGIDFGKLARNIDSGVAVTVNTLLESSAEALDTYETLLDQGKSPEEASQIASKVLGLNMALLTVSNTLLEKYVFNGFNRMPSVNKQLVSALKGGKPVFRPVQQAGVKFGAGVLAEGFIEEGLQTTFQQEEGNFMNSIERYFDNLGSLFGEDPDIEFGKAVFLGGILGGTVGGISGISDVKQQKLLLQGRPARELSGTKGRIQAMLGYKAREVEKGLIDVFLPSFEALKAGKDKLKNSALTTQSKLDPKTLEDETLMFALSNTFDDLVESNNGDITKAKDDLKLILSEEYGIDPKNAGILASKVAPVSNLTSSTAFDLMRAKKDYMYFSRFAAVSGGFEMLDAHIDDMVEAMSDRYMTNTGMQMSEAAKVKLQNDMKLKAKKFKNIYDAGTKYNSNIRFDIDVTDKQKDLFNQFMNIVQTDSLNGMMFKSDLEEQVKALEEETKEVKAEVDRAVSINNNKQQSPDLTKEKKEQAQKEYEQTVSNAKAKVPDYDGKIRDIKLLNAEIQKKSQAVLDNGLASRVKEKWKAFLELQEEVTQAKKLFFDGVEIDFTNIVQAMNTIERILREKGYEPKRDPNTGVVVLDPFYIKQNNKTYIVHARPEGINYEELGAEPAAQKPITWEKFITTRNKATILTIGEFTEIKANYDAAVKEEEDLLMVEAIIKAIVKQSSALEKQLEANKQALSKAKTKAKELESQIEGLQKKIRTKKGKKLNSQEAKDIRDKAKELLKVLKPELQTVNNLIQSLEPHITTLEAQLTALQNLKGFVENNRDIFKGKTFQDIYTQQDLTSMITGLQADEVVPGTDLVERGFAENDMNLLDEFLRNTKNLLDSLSEVQNQVNELRNNLRKLVTLLDTIISETTLGSLRNNTLPDEIANKYIGLREALTEVAKTNDSKPLLDYLNLLSNSVPNGDYSDFLKQFVSTVSPYLPLGTQEIDGYITTISDQVVTEVEQLNAKTLPDRTTALLSRFAVVERFRNELEATRQKVFNKLKKNFKALNQQTPSWDLDSPEPGFEQDSDVDERLNRTEHLFNTSGLNIQFDPSTNRDILTPLMGTDLFVPLVTDDLYQQAFFNWLDNPKQDGFRVLPYAPSYTDADFTDIADEQTAAQLRDAIKNTPAGSRQDVLYTVIVDSTGNVMKFNDIPLINSMMLPETKFPDDKPSRMARRIVLSEFLSDVYGVPVELKTTDLSSTAKITKQGLDKLAEYGIEISDKTIDRKTFFEILDPYAKLYMRKKYSDALQAIRDKSKLEISGNTPIQARDFLDVKGISNGTLITAKDKNGKAVASPIETLGLEFNKAGVPTNFTLLKGDRKGEAKSNYKNKVFTGLKPGKTYIELADRSGLVPVELRNLDQNEVDVILYMLNQIDPNVKTLEKVFPDLEGSIFIKGKSRDLSEIPMLPTMKDRTSLMSFIMNWGFKSKDAVTPYDIYISKGNIVFGKSDSISVTDFRKAYEENNTVALQPLVAFLLNKRINANHLLLNNRSTNFYTFVVETTKDGKKKLKSVQKQGSYANHILTGASTYALPQQMRELHNLPMFAQRYLYFKQGTTVDPAVFKQEVSTRKPSFTPKPGGAPQATGQTRMQEFRKKLDTITTEEQYNGLIGAYSNVTEVFDLAAQVATLLTLQERLTKLKELIDGAQVAEEQEVSENTPSDVFIQVLRGIKTSNNPSDETIRKRAAVLSLIINQGEPTDDIKVMKGVLSKLKEAQDPWIVSFGSAVENIMAVPAYSNKPVTYIKSVLRSLTNDAKKKPTPKTGGAVASMLGKKPAPPTPPSTQPPVISPEMNRLSNKNLSTTEGIIKTGVLEEASLINIDKVVAKDNDGDVRMYVNADKLNGVLLARNGKVLFRAMQGRFFILAKVGNFYLPFYQSSAGTSGKVQGAWYPFFGYNNWLVKGSVGKKGEMEYSKQIDEVTRLINENLKLPASKAGNSYLTQFGRIITAGGTPANLSKVLYDINNDLGYESWYVEFDRKKNNTYTEEQFIKDRTGLDPVNVVNNGMGSANAWINNIIELIEDAEKASKGVIKNIGKSTTTSTDILDDLLESDEGTLYLKRDPKSTLETALKRGIIDRVNCK